MRILILSLVAFIVGLNVFATVFTHDLQPTVANYISDYVVASDDIRGTDGPSSLNDSKAIELCHETCNWLVGWLSADEISLHRLPADSLEGTIPRGIISVVLPPPR